MALICPTAESLVLCAVIHCDRIRLVHVPLVGAVLSKELLSGHLLVICKDSELFTVPRIEFEEVELHLDFGHSWRSIKGLEDTLAGSIISRNFIESPQEVRERSATVGNRVAAPT